MASPSGAKRAWKLQEFVAHGANVNCLALGHKSGRVLVTGGDDKKVNLWAVGKPNCIMSLCGHTTPVECVRFGHTEELVCAGSQSGALKIWDLEAARLVRTLTGHKSGIKCIDFHPYGDFVSSGSTDTNLKLWDIRRKGCIFTYKGHSQTVNSLKFSPDGQWIASAGEEGDVKIWDLRAGKLMNEFHDHGGAVHDIEFHPHEFLLASASADRTVNFWDLESFQLISTTDRDSGPVRAIAFHPDGDCVFSGSHESLKVHTWEPSKVCDNLLMGWGKLKDIAIASNQLVGAAHQMSNVSLYVVDLKKVKPFGSNRQILPALINNNNNNVNNTSFRTGNSMRRSFTKEKSSLQAFEEQTSDRSVTDPEDSDHNSQADINDHQNYENIFRPRRRELDRTPPLPDEPFQAPPESAEVSSTARPQELRIRTKKPSISSPTRRASQPSFSNAVLPNNNGVPVKHRRGSNSARPASVYEPPVYCGDNGRTTVQMKDYNSPGSPSHNRFQRSISVQPRSAANLDYSKNGDDLLSYDTSNRCSSLTRNANNGTSRLSSDFTPLTPVSRIQISSSENDYRPLDKPAIVRNRNSRQSPPQRQQRNPDVLQYIPRSEQHSASSDDLSFYTPPEHYPASPRVQYPGTPSRQNNNMEDDSLETTCSKLTSYVKISGTNSDCTNPPTPTEKIEVVPMNSDKPTGIEMDDFLPKKLGVFKSPKEESKFEALYDRYNEDNLSESEVTSSILKGHESMMSALTSRGRNLEIIQRMWQSKDAKTAVDQAVSVGDQAVIVDLLSVVTLRPSIWNLDLCTALLPPIGELLQSKYEMYINVGCGAMKLILKNFASVIKSNIDSPVQNLGVDISREERHNKCMECYKDLVKIRSLILKRQTMQGKLGHTYRELSILMQYLD